MPKKPPSFLQGEEPESFQSEEFTTADVRSMAKSEDAEQNRVVARARRSGRGQEKLQKPKRGHTTPRQMAAQAQYAEREHELVWKPAESLDAPPAPPGCVLRWIRAKLGDRDDPKNLNKKFRTGWKPFLATDAPEDYTPPETYASPMGTVIAVGDLILCYMPRKLFEARKRYFKNMIQQQKQAVRDRARSQSDSRAPLVSREEATFTRGRRPQVQQDGDL